MYLIRGVLFTLLLISGWAFCLDVQYYHDPTGALITIDIIKNSNHWSFSKSEKIFYFPNEGVLWQKVEPPKSSYDSLEVQYSSLDEVSLYFIKDDNIIAEKKSGLNYPFQKREIGAIYPTFKIDTVEKYDYILVAVKTQAPMQAPIAFTSSKTVIDNHNTLLVIFGVFVGAMAVLGTISKIFASAIGNLEAVNYWLHISCTTTTVLCVYYIPTSLFFVSYPSKWIAHVIMAHSMLYCLSVTAIFRDFIDYKDSIFKNSRFKWITRFLMGGLGILSLFTLHKIIIVVCYFFVLCTIIGIAGYSFIRAKENPRLFRFLAAESIVLIGMLLFVLQGLGFIGTIFYYAFALSICIEQVIFVNGLFLRAQNIQMEKTELLLSEIKARRDKENANSAHISRLSLLLTLARDLHSAKTIADAKKIAKDFSKRELGEEFDMYSFFYETPSDNTQVKTDKIFAKHIFEQLNSAIDAIETNSRHLESETQRLNEKFELEKDNLKNIVVISDQLNSPLMSLAMLLGKMLSFDTNDELVKDPFFDFWNKSKNIIDSSLQLIIKASKSLSEMREKYANIEATGTFDEWGDNGR